MELGECLQFGCVLTRGRSFGITSMPFNKRIGVGICVLPWSRDILHSIVPWTEPPVSLLLGMFPCCRVRLTETHAKNRRIRHWILDIPSWLCRLSRDLQFSSSPRSHRSPLRLKVKIILPSSLPHGAHC